MYRVYSGKISFKYKTKLANYMSNRILGSATSNTLNQYFSTNIPSRICDGKSQALSLLDKGFSVPFIARYRRSETGDMSADELLLLRRELENEQNLAKSKQSKIQNLEKRDLCDEILRNRINSCRTLDELEVLWEQYKEHKTSNASKARSVGGLEQLAISLLDNNITYIKNNIIDVPSDIGMTFIESVQAIITDIIVHNPAVVNLAQGYLETGTIITTQLSRAAKDSAAEEKELCKKYQSYDKFEKQLHAISPHQVRHNIYILHETSSIAFRISTLSMLYRISLNDVLDT